MASITRYISATSDDAQIRSSGSGGYSSTSTALIIGKHYTISDESFTVGLRFINLDIPPGSRINTATLNLHSYYKSADPVSVSIAGEAADNTVTFTSTLHPASRAKTTTRVAWNLTGSNWINGTINQSPNIATILQEIIDRPGWASGNAISVIIYDDGSANYSGHNASSYEGQPATSISVNYTPPPTTTLNSPANNAQLTIDRPTLTFAATDEDGDVVSYQVQVSESSDFSILHTDSLSTSGTGWSGTDPYASGAQVSYEMQSDLIAGGTPYYWRARAKDPLGSSAWGAWSATRTMISKAIPPTVTSGSATSITTNSASVAGNVTADGGATITERGFVYNTSTNPTTANSKKATAGTTGAFSDSLTSLTPNTTYYWRAYAINAKGTSYGSNQSFTTEPRPPTVTTGSSGGTTYNEFTVSGSSLTSNLDSQTIDEFGIVYSTSPTPTIASSSQIGTGTTASWSNNVTSLPDSTTYYVRAYVKWRGTDYAYGSQVTLTTPAPPSPPTVTTSAATSIIDTRVDIASNVTASGDGTVSERGVVFGLTANPTLTDSKVTSITGGTGAYTLRITGLTPNTTYHYRAYAINEYGTGYSTDSTFTTLAELVPDEGDGYWVFSVSESNAIVSRSQATPANSSVNLPLADLGLENGKTYTLAIGSIESELGDPKVSLLYYDASNPVSTDIPESSDYTFTYNTDDYHTWILQLHVTQNDPVVDELTTIFKDLYLAEESSFSSFVPFTPYGQFEIKLENNQIVDKRREDVIGLMFTRLEGWETAPFEVKTEGLGYFEIGDGITIKDPDNNEVKTYLTEYRLEIDGGINEALIGTRPPDAETDYSKAGNIKKLISNTTLQVDKQRQEIEALVQDVYDNDGYIEEKFSQVFQDISQVRTTVQGAGGVNLIRNSVMYAYNNLGYPENWTTTHVDGEGTTIVIQGSAESKAAGGLSGNSFMLNGVKVNQIVTVRKDADFITEENKTYYTFNIKVKKNLVGTAYIKLSNRQEEHIIDLPTGEEYLWEDFTLEGLLPQDDHYEIEIYSDQDAVAQFTDAMLSVGEYTHSWTQAPGEIGNASVSITESGVTIRQDQFRYNYTHLDALGLNVHKRIRGQGEEIFGFNADETNMSKVKANKQMSMGTVRIVPIDVSGMSGWAWTGTEE